MNPELYGPHDPDGAARVGQQLCREVGAVDFDYAALVEGVHQRAGRIRRRRALTTGAIVAVFGPALLGGSALVLPDLLPGADQGSVTPAETPEAALTEVPEPTPLAETEASGEIQEPPWQDAEPPPPASGLGAGESDNAWEIPDARPTGVAYLEALGPPDTGGDYRLVMPVFGPMVGNTGAEDYRPEAGQSWTYGSTDTGAVDINVTGWADSVAARDALRDDTMAAYQRDTEGPWQQHEWADHQGDDDYLLYTATDGSRQFGFAVVRQGDYLIGVTVTDTTGEINAETAAEIASKTAENMEALDPIHGRD